MVVWIQNPFDNLPHEGYRKQRYWLMAEAFSAAGCEVVYFTSDFSHAGKAPRVIVDDSVDRNIRIVFLKTRPYARNVGLKRVCSHREYARSWERAAVGRVDLIIASMPTISGAESALRIGRRHGAKVVIDIQDAWPETFERLAPRGFRWLMRLLLAPLRRRVRRIYREADLLTGVSERYRELTGRSDYLRAYLGVEL